MRKSWVAAACLLLAGFAAATWLRFGESSGDPSAEVRDLDRDRIRTFWEAYHDATEFRIGGDYLHAAQRYSEALEIDPTHEESLYYLGNSQLELGRFEQAKETYRRLTLLNPSSQRAFSQLGVVSSTLRPGVRTDWQEARNAFRRCVEINPEESGPFLRLGWLSLQRLELEDAERHFQTAAGFRSLEGIFLTGFVDMLQDRLQDAVASFTRVLELGAHEAKISGRGVKSEGDLSHARGPLTPVEGAQVKARLCLFWTAKRLGGYPAELPEAFRISPPDQPLAVVRTARPVGAGAGSAVWIDFDVDGDLDLALSGGKNRGPVLFQNRAGRLESNPVKVPAESGGTDQAWGDADGDGDADLLLIRSQWGTPSPPSLYRNEGSPQSPPRFIESRGLGNAPGLEDAIRARFWDYDGDGTQDLVLASGSPRYPLIVLRNRGQAMFSPDDRFQAPPMEGPATDLAIGDLDHDGRDDLVLVRWRRAPVLLINQGQGQFRDLTQESGLSEAVAGGFRGVLLDYDQDGDLDLLLTAFSPYEAALATILEPDRSFPDGPRLFANNGSALFQDVTPQSGLPTAASTMAVAAADLNRDGFPDLVFAEGGPEIERMLPSLILLNRQGRFDPPLRLPGLDQPVNAEGVAVADWKRDGRPEIFLSGSGLYSVRFE